MLRIPQMLIKSNDIECASAFLVVAFEMANILHERVVNQS